MWFSILLLSLAAARVDVYLYNTVVGVTNVHEFVSIGTLNLTGLSGARVALTLSGNVTTTRAGSGNSALYLGGSVPGISVVTLAAPGISSVRIATGNTFSNGFCCPDANTGTFFGEKCWLVMKTSNSLFGRFFLDKRIHRFSEFLHELWHGQQFR